MNVTDSTTSTKIRGPEVDAHGRLTLHLECMGCGYNLKSQLWDGQCPECGESVKESARGRWLRYSDPSWIRRLAIGTRLIWIGLILAVVFSPFLLLMESYPRWAMLSAIGLVIRGIGCWMVTQPEIQFPKSERVLSLRRVARWAAVTEIALDLLARGIVIDQGSFYGLGQWRWPYNNLGLMWSLAWGCFFIAMPAISAYLSHLARRATRGKLSRQLWAQMSALIAVPGIITWLFVILVSFSLIHIIFPTWVWGAGALAWLIYFILVWVWLTLNVFRMSSQLYQTAREANQLTHEQN